MEGGPAKATAHSPCLPTPGRLVNRPVRAVSWNRLSHCTGAGRVWGVIPRQSRHPFSCKAVSEGGSLTPVLTSQDKEPTKLPQFPQCDCYQPDWSEETLMLTGHSGPLCHCAWQPPPPPPCQGAYGGGVALLWPYVNSQLCLYRDQELPAFLRTQPVAMTSMARFHFSLLKLWSILESLMENSFNTQSNFSGNITHLIPGLCFL